VLIGPNLTSPLSKFLQGSTLFFHVFLPLGRAAFNKRKKYWFQQMPRYFFHIFWKKKTKICWREAKILAVLYVYFAEERHE